MSEQDQTPAVVERKGFLLLTLFFAQETSFFFFEVDSYFSFSHRPSKERPCRNGPPPFRPPPCQMTRLLRISKNHPPQSMIVCTSRRSNPHHHQNTTRSQRTTVVPYLENDRGTRRLAINYAGALRTLFWNKRSTARCPKEEGLPFPTASTP
jgi:hypothetical protein